MHKLLVAVGNKGIEEVSDFDISALVNLASDIIHLSPYLFKVEKGVGVFDKGIVGVVFNSEIGKVHHGGVGGSSDTLFHGFGVVAEMAAKFGKRSVCNSITVSDHIVDNINNIFASDFSDDSQLLQDILCFLNMKILGIFILSVLWIELFHLIKKQISPIARCMESF